MNKSLPLVFIADDDRDLVDALAHRCLQFGVRVERAHDGLTALAKINSLGPQLVILDVNMPGGSGLSVLEIISANEHLRSIPVIILTGQENIETMRRCHELLAYFIPKCDEIWPRVEPLLIEHFGDPASGQPRFDEEPEEPATTEIDRSQAKDEEPEKPVAYERDRPYVLCIDDDLDMTRSLQLRLGQHGIALLEAHEGLQGFRSALIETASAIILDYEMPDRNGDYILRRLKENPVTKDVPVVVLTGHGSKHLERQMYDLGAAHFLVKPVDWGTLWSTLKPYVELQQLS